MNGKAPSSTRTEETERVRRIYEKEAPKFDRSMGRWDRVLFAGTREWVCAQASGEVLEIAIGTARNLPFYAENVRLTGIELSPAMIDAGCYRTTASRGGHRPPAPKKPLRHRAAICFISPVLAAGSFARRT